MALVHSISIKDAQPDFFNLADLKNHLKVDFSEDDFLIESYLAAAIESAENYMGSFIKHRDVIVGSAELALFTPAYYGPVIDGVFVAQYTDSNDLTQTITDDFKLVQPWGSDPGFQYVGTDGISDLKDALDALRFSYSAGIKDAASLPPVFQQAIYLLVSEMYEYRTDRAAINNTRAHSLLRPYKRH